MKPNPTDDELLRSYLLGEIPEPEADDLERRLLAEDDLFDLLEALEAELLAAASRGELAPAERERVLCRLASSAEGRERLALARSLNALAGEPAASVVPLRRRDAGPKPLLRWAALAAAVLLAVAGLFWFTRQAPRGGDSALRVAQERPAPASPTQPVPVPEKKPAAPTVATPAPPETPPAPEQLARKEEAEPEKRPEPMTAVLALSLATLRGGEEIERLDLPAGAEVVKLQIDVEGLEESGPFHVAVRSHDQGMIWEKVGLAAQPLDWTTAALLLDVPAKLLVPGRYEVAVTPAAGTGESTQQFDVARESH